MRGRDKLMEEIDGETLIRRQARAAIGAGFDLHVALPAPDHPRARALAGLRHRALVLPGSAEGMGGTLRDGVAALPQAPRFMILLADLPGITAGDLAAVAAAARKDAENLIWRGADQSGAPGHPILFDARIRPDFARLGGDSGGREIIAAHRDRIRLIPLPGDRATRDLDTPEDWAAWRDETGP